MQIKTLARQTGVDVETIRYYEKQGLLPAPLGYWPSLAKEEFLAEMWPAVLQSVNYLETLRNQRLTAEYRTPERRACYGLLPESMSHEGYMAHPVHAYWDDFWALRGFKDAAAMAEILGDGQQAKRIAALREDFQETLYASLNLVIRERALDFVPGSVEFADFDPTATAMAISVADELHRLPHPAPCTVTIRNLPAERLTCRAYSLNGKHVVREPPLNGGGRTED
jgi:hypothetical protein